MKSGVVVVTLRHWRLEKNSNVNSINNDIYERSIIIILFVTWDDALFPVSLYVLCWLCSTHFPDVFPSGTIPIPHLPKYFSSLFVSYICMSPFRFEHFFFFSNIIFNHFDPTSPHAAVSLYLLHRFFSFIQLLNVIYAAVLL